MIESFFSAVRSEAAERFERCAETKEVLFDYIEVFYCQRRCHSALARISPGVRTAVRQ